MTYGFAVVKTIVENWAPLMLLRNQDQVQRTRQRVISEHLQGKALDGELGIIPLILLISLEGDFAFTLTRRQLPVRLCFAITAIKS